MTKPIEIKPQQLEEEKKAFELTTEYLSDLSNSDLKDIKKDSLLDTVDELEAIIGDFFDCVDSYVELSNIDVKAIEKLKNDWIAYDKELAGK